MPSKNEVLQRDYFDHLARQRTETANAVKSRDVIFSDVDAVLDSLPRSHSILEIGCGDGTSGFTEHFLSQGHRVSFLDVSSEAVRKLANRLSLAGYKDFRPLSGTFIEVSPALRNETFDVIFFGDTLHHLTEQETTSLARDIQPFMRSHSKVVGFEPNGHWPLWRVMPYFNKEYVWEMEKNVRHCTYGGFVRKFGKTGLKLERYIYQRIVPLPLMDLGQAFVVLNRLLTNTPVVRLLSSYTIVVAGLRPIVVVR